MPAKSKAQQKAAGAALSAKRGDTKKSELKGASKSMYESMSEKQLEEFAETKRKGKPEHVSKKN
jgi:putative salt-induced outer membrane protein YdiY